MLEDFMKISREIQTSVEVRWTCRTLHM